MEYHSNLIYRKQAFDSMFNWIYFNQFIILNPNIYTHQFYLNTITHIHTQIYFASHFHHKFFIQLLILYFKKKNVRCTAFDLFSFYFSLSMFLQIVSFITQSHQDDDDDERQRAREKKFFHSVESLGLSAKMNCIYLFCFV